MAASVQDWDPLVPTNHSAPYPQFSSNGRTTVRPRIWLLRRLINRKVSLTTPSTRTTAEPNLMQRTSNFRQVLTHRQGGSRVGGLLSAVPQVGELNNAGRCVVL